MPAPAPLAAPLAALCAAIALAGLPGVETTLNESRRAVSLPGQATLAPGCLYEGRWFAEGAPVPTGEACLQCACRRGALSCRRRSCAALPDPPPRRCHVLHRRGSCCPELHCTDGVIMMEHGASARSENEEEINTPVSLAHACVEGGSVYAAGSAMRSTAACEQCFCLGGGRRCVRPRCLPPPPGCKPRPAPGACCPQRYYCDHRTTKPPEEKHPHDCKIDGKWISEGEKIVSVKMSSNCTQCFCLRGAAQCQPLACAPLLLDCKPLLRPGECCAHQYHCDRGHSEPSMPHFLALASTDALTSARNDQTHVFNPLPSSKEATTKTTLASIYLVKNTRITSATNNLVSTIKVKRKTSDPPPSSETSSLPSQNATEVIPTKPVDEPTTLASLIASTESAPITDFTSTTETTSTEQPEGSVRIMINGTINCTAELSSTSLPLNVTFNDTNKLEKITMESHPRIPLIDVSNLEDHTFSPNDIITDRNVNGEFDENESFVINVTSSLRANTSQSSTVKPTTTVKPTPIVTKVSIPANTIEALNSSKKTKGDYDYDYTEPTLPPSLPNLKIIPFVAADAVVEDERPKETQTYPIHEREDKFPVYYPNINNKDTSFTRREDAYRSTQYPVFITDKTEEQYPSLIQDGDLTSTGYSNVNSDLSTSGNEYTVSTSLGSRVSDFKKDVTPQPLPSTTYKLKTPVVNLFSPPVETEGGFVPKGPSGLIDEYYAVFPSTPSGPPVPHLTTSMPLDIAKDECITGDGRHILEGDTVTLACSECRCSWGELHCAPRACHTPPRCTRRPATTNSADLCCGQLICEEDNKTTPTIDFKNTEENTTSENIRLKNETDILKNLEENKTPIINITKIDEPISDNHNIFSEPSYPHQNDFNVSFENKAQVENNKNMTDSTSYTFKKNDKAILTTTTTETTKEPELEDKPLDYEEEEEDDESFSFGNVLKLLLSGDSYETTTTATKILQTTSKMPPVKSTTTTRRPRPTLPSVPKPTVIPFVPMPLHPFIPPKIPQNPINRIDHLVLGEATAIKRTTFRPAATSPKPTSVRAVTRPTTQRWVMKQTEVTKTDIYTSTESPSVPAGLSGLGPGLLKLAGCNIYGQMYRVGRIIAELSTPCQECWCTEFGVQCKQLKC